MEEKNKIINDIENNNMYKKKRKRKRKKKSNSEISNTIIQKNNLNNIDLEIKEVQNIKTNNKESQETNTYDIEIKNVSDIIINNEIELSNDNKPKKKRNLTPIIIFPFSIAIIIIGAIIISYFNIKLSLVGNKKEKIEVLNTYEDPGFKATIFKKNISNKVTIISNVDTNKIGTYTISYKLPSPINKQIKRTVEVIDSTKPTINLISSDNITTYTNEPYVDKGVVIKDNYDKDLIKNLIVENNLDTSKEGTYIITYTVTDSSNNTSSIKRTVTVKNRNICNQNNPIEKYICNNNYNISVEY